MRKRVQHHPTVWVAAVPTDRGASGCSLILALTIFINCICGADLLCAADAVPQELAEKITLLDGMVEVHTSEDGKQSIEISFRSSNRLRDGHLRLLNEVDHLRSLDISHTRITDNGLREIARFDRLEVLNLNSVASVTDEGLEILGGLHSLQSLNLENTKAGRKALQSALNCPRLSSLNVSHTSVTDVELARLLRNAPLVELDVCGTGVTDGVFVGEPPSQTLRSLSASFTTLTDESLKVISKMSRMKHLNLRSTGATKQGIRLLPSQLESLDLSSTAVTDDSIEDICPMRELRSLELSRIGLTDKGLARLCALSNLETLNLAGTRITTLTPLQALHNLSSPLKKSCDLTVLLH